MSKNGYIRVHRKILDWEWYGDINTKVIFFHLLLCANWEDSTIRGALIKRGQLITTVKELATINHLTVEKTKTALKHLQLTNEITITSTTKFSVITLNNFDLYQADNKQANNQTTNEQQTVQQADKNQNNKPTIYNKKIEKTNILEEGEKGQRSQADGDKKSVPQKSKSIKKSFAEFVTLTDEEYNLLIERFGEDGVKWCIQKLDNYKGSTGKTYTSDYRTILGWVKDSWEEGKARQQKKRGLNTPPNNSPPLSKNPFINAVLGGGVNESGI